MMNELDNFCIQFTYAFTEVENKHFACGIKSDDYIYNDSDKTLIINYVLKEGETLQEKSIVPEVDEIMKYSPMCINRGTGCIQLNGKETFGIKKINIQMSYYRALNIIRARLIYFVK